jgi:predicted RNase H-like HicB family nuclease
MEEKLIYPALFTGEKGTSVIDVTFPDLPGCVSQGDNASDALSMAQEALLLHIEGMLEDGEDLPRPAALQDIESEAGQAIILVSITDPRKRERFNLSAAAADLAKIDRSAQQRGMTRSAFMVHAALMLSRGEKERASLNG